MRGFSALVTPRGDAGAAAVAQPPAVRPATDRSLTGWRRALARTCTIVGIGAAAWCAPIVFAARSSRFLAADNGMADYIMSVNAHS